MEAVRLPWSADVLEQLALEKRLEEYARFTIAEGFPLVVEELFEGGLADMGHEKLSNVMMLFSEAHVRTTATRIFATIAAAADPV